MVKCKGKSPTFTKQTQTRFAPLREATGDAPSQGAPKKRRGGKGLGKAWAHAIVSSALVLASVTKCLQETHHVVAPVPAPTSAPIVASTVVGGPLHAPITRVPTTIASFKPVGVTYTKQEVPKSAQAFTGYTSQDGPHTMRKPPTAWNGPMPSAWPPVTLEAQMACARIVKNAVASLSAVTLDTAPEPTLGSHLEHIPTPTLEQWLEHDACQKAKRSKTRRGCKAPKKDSVHQAPIDPSLKGKNIRKILASFTK